MSNPVTITAAEAVCALGDNLQACLNAWQSGRSGLKLVEGRLQGQIADRTLMKGRRYGAASNLAVHVARHAAQKAGWGAEALRQSWLFAASSRGNAGELLGRNGWRRPSTRFAASNTIHSEIAAAVSIELGIRGPWQMLSSGCSAGLDALGMAWMALQAGLTRRALVVAVDLPLIPELITAFQATHLLSTNGVNDPLSPETTGLHLGEAGVAVTLEVADEGLAGLTRYAANSDAYDSLMIPEDGGPLAELLGSFSRPALICPHATGTPNHARAEMQAITTAFGAPPPPLLLMKPLTGHTLGACGLLDTALLAGALTCPGPLPPLSKDDEILKITSGMGGHNAAVALRVLNSCPAS